jgi:hypothetical protein
MVIFILKVINMAFRTKLDYSDNRQINQRERTSTVLSGGSVFGVAYSALTSGIDYTSTGGTEFVPGPLISTFSGNGTTTIFTWYDPRMDLVNSQVSAITNTTSGLSQQFTAFAVDSTGTTLDGYDYNAFYTGVTFEFQTQLIYSGVGPSYTGTVSSSSGVTFLSANSLDYSGRTIWIDNPEITRTKRFIVTNNPSIGHVLTCNSAEGEATWGSISAATSGVTFWEEGGTSNGAIKDEKGGHSLSGGVSKSMIAGGQNNTLTESAWSMMGGGLGNTIEGSSDRSSIIGGANNTLTNGSDESIILVGGGNTMKDSDYSAIIAGENNKLSGGSDSSAIIGGVTNSMSGDSDASSIVSGAEHIIGNSSLSSIIGGRHNIINGTNDAIIGGGEDNTILSGERSVILGGLQNTVTGHTDGAIIGGTGNTIDFCLGGYGSVSSSGEFILGGFDNLVYNSEGSGIIGSSNSGLSGGTSSVMMATSGSSMANKRSVLLGGTNNTIGSTPGYYQGILSLGYPAFDFGYGASSIIGGLGNSNYGSFTSIIGGVNNKINADCSVGGSSIIGGHLNTISGDTWSSIIGGQNNEILSGSTLLYNSDENSIIGGDGNTISASTKSFIGGGEDNTILSSDKAVILGGNNLNISGSSDNSVMVGGEDNIITAGNSFIGGGNDNSGFTTNSAIVAGDNCALVGASDVTLMAGQTNYAENARYSFITGYQNKTYTFRSALVGGAGNTISGASSLGAIIGGGEDNNIIDSRNGVIIGGSANTISLSATTIVNPVNSAIIGGSHNAIVPANGATSTEADGSHSAIVGGEKNLISGHTNSFIGGGSGNTISFSPGYNAILGGGGNIVLGGYSAIIGGENNQFTSFSNESAIIAGTNNSMSASRSVVIGGQNIAATTSDMVYVPDLIIDGIGANDPIATNASGQIVAGTSDRRLKTKIEDLTSPLDKILNLRGVSYEWTEESNMGAGVTKFGFIAQEVQEVIPDMVRIRAKSKDTLTLAYTEIVPWLVEAVKELAGDNSPILNRDELILETQTIASEDNNIELNFNGTHDSALNGGITVIKGINDETNSVFEINSDGDWRTNNYILPHGLVIPKFTPISTNDDKGKLGEITRDDDYIYIKTEAGWKRTGLETF